MSIIKLGPIETLASAAIVAASGTTLKKEDYQSTSICALSSTLATSLIENQNIQVSYTQKYIDSLTDSELAAIVERITDKSDDQTYMTIDIHKPEEEHSIKK